MNGEDFLKNLMSVIMSEFTNQHGGEHTGENDWENNGEHGNDGFDMMEAFNQHFNSATSGAKFDLKEAIAWVKE
jgi:hypothetical protein